MYINFLIISVFTLLLGIGLQMMGDDLHSFTMSFLAVICYIIAVLCLLFFVTANAIKNEVKNQDITKDLNSQIYYIRGYITSTTTKDNDYYAYLIENVEKYNEIYNTYKKDTKIFNVTPKEEFKDYQEMVYNYENNTITWEDGTSILKGGYNNGY